MLTSTERRRLARVGALLGFGSLLEAAAVAAVFPFLQTLLREGTELPAASSGAMSFLDDLDIRTAGLGLLGFYLVKNLVVGFAHYRMYRTVADVRVGVTSRTFRLFMREPYERHIERDLAEVQRAVQLDAGLLVSQTIVVGLTLLSEALVISFMLALLLILQPMATLTIGMVGGAAVTIWHFALRHRLSRHGAGVQAAKRDMIRAIVEGLQAFKEARVLHIEPFFERSLRTSTIEFGKAETFKGSIGPLPRLILELILMTALVVWASVVFAGGEASTATVAAIGVYIAAALRLVPSLGRIASSSNQIRYARTGVLQLADLLAEPQRETAEVPVPAGFTSLEMHDVGLTYPGADSPALEHISLRIERGEVVAIVGASGSGKTTLVDLILGLLTPTTGTVDWVAPEQPDSSSAICAYLPQRPYVAPGTIRDNLVLGLDADEMSDERCWHALEEASLSAEIRSKPEALGYNVGEAGGKLSGGQRQRLALARSLARGASLIVLDEPTAALDKESAEAVVRSWNNLAGHATVLVVTHDPAVAAQAGRTIAIRDGRLVDADRASA